MGSRGLAKGLVHLFSLPPWQCRERESIFFLSGGKEGRSVRLVAGQAEVNSLGYLRHLERKYLFILKFLILTSTQDLEMTDQRTNDRLLERTGTHFVW